MSKVLRNGKPARPSWNYIGTQSPDGQTLEMIESLRNVAEGIHTELVKLNTLLHCSNFTNIPHRLKRISRNTFVAKHKKEPGKYDV
jgi:hypothetical protein